MKPNSIIKKITNVLLIGLLVIVSVNCKMKEEENAIFELSSLSPGAKVSHLPGFTLTVNGSGFIEDSVIIFNGVEKITRYIDSKKITCTIDSADITPLTFTAPAVNVARSESTTIAVSVHNPGDDGDVDSNTLDFVIYDNHRFSSPVSIDDRSVEFRDPTLAVDDSGNIYVVYTVYDRSTDLFSIDFVCSGDSGETWETPIRLAWTQYGCSNPCIALDSGGNINTAFCGAGALYFMRSPAGGTGWTSPTALSNQSGESLEPTIAVDSEDAVSIAWPQKDYSSNYPVYFIRSANGGTSWNTVQNIFAGYQYAAAACSPDIAFDDDNGIYVSWSYKTGGGVQYSCLNRSLDGGATWKNSDIDLGRCSCADIAAAPNRDIYCVLASSRDGDIRDIVFRKSTDRGASWSEETGITRDRTASAPKMVIDAAGNIDVVYCCEDGEEFLFCRSTNEGAVWSSEIQVTHSGTGDIDMTVDSSGTVYFIYVDENFQHLYFIRSSV